MFAVLSVLLVVSSAANGESADSYLEAYHESHGTTEKTDREYTEQFPYPPHQPEYQYGPPKYAYGPPAHHQNYGPPPLVPVYGPPAPAPFYGMPHGMLSFIDKLKFKLDLFTIGKILLKIVIFKKFVSFVAILCLLLFIPSLKRKVDEAVPDGGDDEDDEAMREYGAGKQKVGDEVLNNITQFVVGAIDNFSKNYTEEGKCDSVYCQTKKVVQGIDNKLSYRKLAEAYSREIQP